jgi:hypothetical protein
MLTVRGYCRRAGIPVKIQVNWQGNVGGKNRFMSFGADGTFGSLVRVGGFISITPSPGRYTQASRNG